MSTPAVERSFILAVINADGTLKAYDYGNMSSVGLGYLALLRSGELNCAIFELVQVPEQQHGDFIDAGMSALIGSNSRATAAKESAHVE